MRILAFALLASLVGTSAYGNTVKFTWVGQFDLAQVVWQPVGSPAESYLPQHITRTYSVTLNDEAGALRRWKYNIDDEGGGDFYVSGNGEYLQGRPDILEVQAGFRVNSISEFRLVFDRQHQLKDFFITSPQIDDWWDVVRPGTWQAYTPESLPSGKSYIGRYEGTGNWSVEVAPIPLSGTASLGASAVGLLGLISRRKKRLR